MTRLKWSIVSGSLAALVVAAGGSPLRAQTPYLVKDIDPVSTSFPKTLTRAGDVTFFNAREERHGNELWKSDGTAAGTVLVADIVPGTVGSFPRELVNVVGTLFFVAFDDDHSGELWKSDGSAAGTMLVKDIVPGDLSSFPGPFTSVSNMVFFPADDQTAGPELWRATGQRRARSGSRTLARGRVGRAWRS